MKLLDNESLVGRMVYSKAGRDKGKLYIIIEALDNDYVLVCDGVLRTLNRPKKKKFMHLGMTNTVFSCENADDLIIAKFLKSYDKIKEV
ncbi:MAG: RNA-binding protein [Clostridiaceae bacterium]